MYTFLQLQKKIKFTAEGTNNIVVGIVNKLECLGQKVELTAEFIGNWEFSKSSFKN